MFYSFFFNHIIARIFHSFHCATVAKTATLLSISILSLSQYAMAQTNELPVLNVYSYDSFISEWGPGKEIEERFEAVCECDVVFKSPGSAANVIQAYNLEGHKTTADVLLGIDVTLLNDVAESEITLAHNINWQEQSLNSPLEWPSNEYATHFVPFNYGYFNFIYRANALDNVPSSFEQLLDSPLQLIIQDPRSSSPGMGLLMWIKALYGDNAQQAWGRLADNVLITTSDWSEAYNMFLENRGDMVLSYSTSPVYHQLVEQSDEYKAAWFSEGHILQSEYAAIAASTKNKDLAKRFLTFLTSKEAQYAIANKNWMLPVASTEPVLSSAFDEAKNNNTPNLFIDSEAFSKHKRDWINEYVFGLAGR